MLNKKQSTKKNLWKFFPCVAFYASVNKAVAQKTALKTIKVKLRKVSSNLQFELRKELNAEKNLKK
jgi:hypothetical protein